MKKENIQKENTQADSKISELKSTLVNEFLETLEEVEKNPTAFREKVDERLSVCYSAVTGMPYSWKNSQRLIKSARVKNFTDERWLTFKQAKANGWNIKAGSKSTSITFIQRQEEKDQQSENKDNIIKDNIIKDNIKDNIIKDNIKDNIIKERKVIVKKFSLFNADQVEGMPPIDRKPKKIVDQDIIKNVSEALNIKVQFSKIFKEGANATYNANLDVISLPDQAYIKDTDDYGCLFLHEAVHATGTKNRLNRDSLANYASRKARAKEELVAEIGAVFLSDKLNCKYDVKESANYVKDWHSLIKEDNSVLFDCMQQAGKAVKYICDKPQVAEIVAKVQKDRSCGTSYQDRQQENIASQQQSLNIRQKEYDVNEL